MAKGSLYIPGLAVLIVAGVPGSAGAASDRDVILTYSTVVTDLPATARRVDVWLPVPRETEVQRVVSVRVDAPSAGRMLTESRYGNRVWHGKFTPPATGRIEVVLTAEVIRRERSSEGRSDVVDATSDVAAFLGSNRMVPLTDRFSTIARSAAHDAHDTLSRARSLFDHVLERMTYDKSGTGWGRGDANYACDVGKGNCSDFHSYFIALARSLKIPARLWMGLPLPPRRGQGDIGGYHCWAEFWLDGRGWVPVDISEADKHPQKRSYYFGRLDENRIAFTLGRDLVLSPPQQGPPLNFFVYPYVEVDGQPWPKVERVFRYRDLP